MNIIRIRFSLLTMILAMTWGCVTGNVKPDYTLKPGEKGLAIFSVTQSGLGKSWETSVSFRQARKQSKPYKGNIHSLAVSGPGRIPGGTIPLDFDSEMKGRLVFIELNEGVYELSRWQAARNEYGGVRTLSSPKPFSYEFAVVGGKAVYAGNLHLSIAVSIGKFNLSATDKRNRDLDLLKEKLPNVRREDIVIDIMKKN
ncbi:MAG: hypothetical protein OEZ04_12390 [Nitrospinota bacterium]|nr:hypothetical protein [Nitrospinota bacterium]